MSFGFPTAVRNALGDALITYAGSAALLRIYKGSKPAVGGSPGANDLLAQLTWSGNISAGTANGVIALTLPQTQTSSGPNSGTASWARIVKADGSTVVVDMTVTATGGGGDLTVDNTTINAGGTVAVTSGSITVGNAT
jgi:hypothetical protein